MLADGNEYLKAAYSQLQVISQDENKRMEYEARQKAIRDYNEGMLESHERGLKQGRAEGRKEIILSLLDSLSIEQIASMLKIPISEVQQIAES